MQGFPWQIFGSAVILRKSFVFAIKPPILPASDSHDCFSQCLCKPSQALLVHAVSDMFQMPLYGAEPGSVLQN